VAGVTVLARAASGAVSGAVALLVGGAALLGALGPLAAPALAACDAPPAVEDAVRSGEVVFVGTVTFLENSDRWAVVDVQERWRGADALGESVQVHGGGDPGSVTPFDRSYEPRQYLFVVKDAGDYLEDNACSGTQPWTEALARLRPDGVPAVAPGSTGSPFDLLASGDAVVVAALAGALLVAIVAYILILRRRRRPPDWRR
jgi:hypothetical protein